MTVETIWNLKFWDLFQIPNCSWLKFCCFHFKSSQNRFNLLHFLFLKAKKVFICFRGAFKPRRWLIYDIVHLQLHGMPRSNGSNLTSINNVSGLNAARKMKCWLKWVQTFFTHTKIEKTFHFFSFHFSTQWKVDEKINLDAETILEMKGNCAEVALKHV